MSQWIGLLGKILTGFTMVFTIKYIGGSGSNFPIIQFYECPKTPWSPSETGSMRQVTPGHGFKASTKGSVTCSASAAAPGKLWSICLWCACGFKRYIYMCMYIRIYVILQIMYIYKIVSDYIRYGIILLYYAYTWPVKLKISNMSHKHLDLSNMFFLQKKSEAASAKNQDRTWLNVWWTGKLVCRIITY